MSRPFQELLEVKAFAGGLEVQSRVLADFHRRAARVLEGICPLRKYEEADYGIGRNIFSVLFLAVQWCSGVPAERRFFYGLINQCMRAWVTGCDNLLDDEFKSVLPFDLARGGYRFQSVLTIMTADRILCDLLAEEVAGGRIPAAAAKSLSHMTLQALGPSGLQEHEEELGASSVLPPDMLLEKIHLPKTGLLFEAPIQVAEMLGEATPRLCVWARAGLRAFGLACQILDDIVDLDEDFENRRHNFVLSLAVHVHGESRGASPKHADLDIKALSIAQAKKQAFLRSSDFFEEARANLEQLGLRFSEEEWRKLLKAIMVRLRLPPEVI